jgi:hypothetical protein
MEDLDGQWNDERKGIAWCASRRAKTARKKEETREKEEAEWGGKEGLWRCELLK